MRCYLTKTSALETPRKAIGAQTLVQPRPVGKMALAALALSAIVLIANGLRMVGAGFADLQVRAFLVDWEAKRTEPSSKAWQVAHQAAVRAVAYFPAPNGAYLERLGHVNAWQHFRHPRGDAHAQLSRQSAKEAYRDAIKYRPTWPYLWVSLARTKLDLLEFDPEFASALTQAQHHAPWRPEVNGRLAEVGFSTWTLLSSEQRDDVLTAAARAVVLSKNWRAPIFKLANRTAQTYSLCVKAARWASELKLDECADR